MASLRDLPFPFVIISLVFIRGYCPLPTTGMYPMRPLNPRGFSLPPNDYYEEYTVTPVSPRRASPEEGTSKRCDYDRCLESQAPCAELAASTGCSCPGFTWHNVAPEAPLLKSVSWNGSEVVLQWCAPLSYVTSYSVTVGGQERQKFEEGRRSGAVGDIDNIAKVCVVAVNEVGESEGSCMMYQPRDNNLPLTAGLIGGALGLLLLLLLAVLLWRRNKRQRKQQASISMHNTSETR